MKKTKKLILTSIIACCFISTKAQDTESELKGQAIIQVFGNFHTGFGSSRNDRGFELDRSYLGYQYSFGKGLSIKGVIDIGKSNAVNDYHRIAYIKNAMINWETGKLTLNGGLISTTQFNMQEKFWGYRYILKSFQDQYKFGSSADLGISASYKFNDIISADAIIVNGEGYKKVQLNDGLQYGLGITIVPIKGLSVRLYSGYNECATKGQKDTWNYATFIGYKAEKFSIGAEYNYIQNAGFTKDADQSGISVYTSGTLSKKVNIFARYDQLFSKNDWNISKEETALIAGTQLKFGKYVKVAPNIRVNFPNSYGADNTYTAYINCYFGF